MSELNNENALSRINDAVSSLPDHPPDDAGLSGRGIVICAGGIRYFVCAWVCINMLRKQGCQLPIQMWHLGPNEVNDAMRRLLEPLNVVLVDAEEVRTRHPVRTLNGWEVKPYAIIHSPFREVLALDADNVALIDPEFLFDTASYREHGAIFWPDYGRLNRDRMIWKLTGTAYQDEAEFESGQIVVDKVRCWKALALTMWMNEHSDFWYRHVHGDKETFHMAWRKIDQSYAMPKRGIHSLNATMCQHDFDGRRIFQHRNLAKWKLTGNSRIGDFEQEDDCISFLNQLRLSWGQLGSVSIYCEHEKTEEERQQAQHILSQTWVYHRVGYDKRTMSFRSDGTIGEGAAELETLWNLKRQNGTTILELLSSDALTCRLYLNPGEVWRGHWERFEKMPIELFINEQNSFLVQDFSQQGEQDFISAFFKDVANGYFIDIGAGDGVRDSNTRALFERGWSGILVEPVPEVFWRLQDNYRGTERIKLVNAAISDSNGYGQMWVARPIQPEGLNDNRHTLSIEFAEQAKASSKPATYDIREIRLITAKTLYELLQTTKIDFLSIDAEGLDSKIAMELLSIGLRPRLIIAESYKQELLELKLRLVTLGYKQIFTNSINTAWALFAEGSNA